MAAGGGKAVLGYWRFVIGDLRMTGESRHRYFVNRVSEIGRRKWSDVVIRK
jgi:hypothetical protein